MPTEKLRCYQSLENVVLGSNGFTVIILYTLQISHDVYQSNLRLLDLTEKSIMTLTTVMMTSQMKQKSIYFLIQGIILKYCNTNKLC